MGYTCEGMVGRQEKRVDGCRLNGHFPCHTPHSFTLPVSWCSPCPSHCPRVCEIGVVVAVVCLIRSVLLIGGYYTYSNLFCLVSLFFFTLVATQCVRLVWIFFKAHDDTSSRHATSPLPLLFFSLLRMHNHSRFRFRPSSFIH